MKAKNLMASVVASLVLTSAAFADDAVVGRIQMIQPYIPAQAVYVHLQGYPQLDGGGCRGPFFVGRMDDPQFKTFIYPVLLTAKVENADIQIRVQGCAADNRPQIVGVEYSPRQ